MPPRELTSRAGIRLAVRLGLIVAAILVVLGVLEIVLRVRDRKSTRLNSSHGYTSYAVFCLKKKIVIFGSIAIDSTAPSTLIPRPTGTRLNSLSSAMDQAEYNAPQQPKAVHESVAPATAEI